MVDCLNASYGDRFAAYHGDCVEVISQLPDASVHLSVFSPPFSGLYVYSDSIADMGNSADDEEFFKHYSFLARQLYRVTKPGRLCVVHCKDLVLYKTQTGFDAGLRDFPGMLVAAHKEAGWTFHSRITVWRCPVREMTKTKAHGLLYKQLRTDSTFSRQGLPEYMMVFRKWAREEDAIEPVTHTAEDFPLEQWQKYASPVWMDTRETNVLNAIRAPGDEKHICPLPLDLIERSIKLYSNPNDVVLSPFMGIGSEGYGALKAGRRFIGTELKEEYWRQATRHLTSAEQNAPTLFDQLMGDAA
ncbi:site-specific DNA-methyltransferase [Roseococcus sp. SDR]|uniref:DNA-methyltransferase n=1 Tax=Roseococcus sp. SDR TaxID=2835532 RepID=UPI001BCFC0EC|nr:site-specific DNA-methyltransferase [Roseococcus sp. SDR]MBS7789244.1 site-specific DNA-methyltransferase [Roseococcus sp. SDR]MBV1844558.1 site-specific DNA-methyltransferase [Roseococcus sp. SDR]